MLFYLLLVSFLSACAMAQDPECFDKPTSKIDFVDDIDGTINVVMPGNHEPTTLEFGGETFQYKHVIKWNNYIQDNHPMQIKLFLEEVVDDDTKSLCQENHIYLKIGRDNIGKIPFQSVPNNMYCVAEINQNPAEIIFAINNVDDNRPYFLTIN